MITAALVGFVAAGSIEFCDSEPCQTGSCSVQSPGTEGVNCRQLGGIKSAFVLSVDDGCSCMSKILPLHFLVNTYP